MTVERKFFAESILVIVHKLVELKLLFWQLKTVCAEMLNGWNLLKRVGFVWPTERPDIFRRGDSQNRVPVE